MATGQVDFRVSQVGMGLYWLTAQSDDAKRFSIDRIDGTQPDEIAAEMPVWFDGDAMRDLVVDLIDDGFSVWCPNGRVGLSSGSELILA